MLHDAFESDSENPDFFSSQPRNALEVLYTKLRLLLDVERRLTPWDWRRHRQLVVEQAGTGALIGFAEIWAEDAASLGNVSAQTPQPVLFNLCVARSARRSGVAAALVSKAEEQCASWGDDRVFLKVREDNTGGQRLYESCGYDTVESRPPADLPDWQARWKGGALPLVLMSKRLAPSAAAEAPVPARGFDEFAVTYDMVREYADRDAYIWFFLLLLRNSGSLTPAYRLLPLVAVLAGFASYELVVKLLLASPP